MFSRGPCGFTRSRFRAYKGQKNAIVQRAARRTHRLPSRSGSTRSRVQGLRARKAHACRGAFRGARKTHRLPSRCDSSRSRVYGLEKCMRAGVRLGGPEKRTGSLRVCDSTRSRVQGLRARKTYAWTMEKCILPLAFKQLDCVISGRAVLGRKFLGRACRTPGRAARRS